MAWLGRTKPKIFIPNRHPIRRDLIIDCPFLERSTSGAARNLSQTRLDGTYSGSVTFEGVGANLGNGSGRIEFGDHNEFDVSYGMTIETLFRIDSADTNGQLLKKDVQYIMRYRDTNEFRCFIWTSTSQHEIQYDGITATTGDWYHMAYTWDKQTTTMKLYLNGVHVASNTGADGNASTTGNALCVGTATGGGESSDHTQAFMRMWKRALSGDEVQQLYADPWVIYRRKTLTLPNVDLFSLLGKAPVTTSIKDLISPGIIAFPR